MVLFLEVVAHPLFNVLGLPDVEDFSICIFVEVAAGKAGEGSEVDHSFNALYFKAILFLLKVLMKARKLQMR
jgi:hypothetical protein